MSVYRTSTKQPNTSARAEQLTGLFRNDEAIYFIAIAVVGCAAFYFIYFIERYLGLTEQFVIGWATFILLYALNKIEAFKAAPLRFVFILLSGFMAIRYFAWRTFDTLIYTGPIDLTAMLLLYFAELYAASIHFLGLFINLWPKRTQPAPMPATDEEHPVVDVFIPTYNEPVDIVRTTVCAAMQIIYPKSKLRVYILDDGSTVAKRSSATSSGAAWERHYELKRLADEYGANYITRERNEHAKAGNINHALGHTSGELVLILDCDHVPTRDILNNTVGLFKGDPKLFLVQTPHFFINPTPVEKNVAAVSDVPGENDMFYRVIHLGLDSWNASYFCGSAALLRRKHLEAVGGISGKTITEDAETSYALHNLGLSSAYIDRPMVCGLSPETFDDYIVQRTRWAQGMVQLFLLNNPLSAKGMSLGQRLCYFNSCFFWFFGFSRIVFYIAPVLFLVFGLKIYHAAMGQVIAYSLPYVLSTIVIMNFFYGRVRKPLYSEIYESVQSIFLLPAVVSVLLNPTKPTFKITPKGTQVGSDRLNPLAAFFFLLILANAVALPLGIVKMYQFPLYRDIIIVTSSWCAYNLFVSLASLGAFWEKKQVRRHHRVFVSEPVEVFLPRTGRRIKGTIKDLSLTGMGFVLNDTTFDLVRNDKVVVETTDSFGERFRFDTTVHRHRPGASASFFGVEFDMKESSYADVVRFVYGDSRRWNDIWESRSRPSKTLPELLHLVVMGLRASGESLGGLAGATWTGVAGVAGTVSRPLIGWALKTTGVAQKTT